MIHCVTCIEIDAKNELIRVTRLVMDNMFALQLESFSRIFVTIHEKDIGLVDLEPI